MNKFNKQEYDFEDLFTYLGGDTEIVTPSVVESKIASLDSAWEALYNNNKKDIVIASEYAAWSTWRDNVNNSYLSKVFASGTLNDLDEWKIRYANAYQNDKTKAAPSPTLFKTREQEIEDSPAQIPGWVLVATGIGLGVAAVWYFTKTPTGVITRKLIKKAV